MVQAMASLWLAENTDLRADSAKSQASAGRLAIHDERGFFVGSLEFASVEAVRELASACSNLAREMRLRDHNALHLARSREVT